MAGWNGQDLVDEFSTLLGDTKNSFKTKVCNYINDIMIDIAARHGWNWIKFQGGKLLTATEEEQSMNVGSPDAPTVAASSGGSLTNGTYRVKVSYGESVSDIEGLASTRSDEVTTTTGNNTISLTSVSLSTDPLVNRRHIYVALVESGVVGEYKYHGTISNNTTATYSIDSDPDTNDIQNRVPLEYSYIAEFMGSPYFIDSGQLCYKDIDQLRLAYGGTWGTGTPVQYDFMGDDRFVLQPAPSAAQSLYFYYYKTPAPIFYSKDSIPELPPFLKETLTKGVEWKGYNYRDRSGKIEMKNLYEADLFDMISRKGRAGKTRRTVRDVVGNADGFVLE